MIVRRRRSVPSARMKKATPLHLPLSLSLLQWSLSTLLLRRNARRSRTGNRRSWRKADIASLLSEESTSSLVAKEIDTPVVAPPAGDFPRHLPDDECSASPCSHPVGEAVEWVQCDTCQRWFHLTCVGLLPVEAQSMDSYACLYCRSALLSKVASAATMDDISIEDSTAASMLLAVAQSGLPSGLGNCFGEDADSMDTSQPINVDGTPSPLSHSLPTGLLAQSPEPLSLARLAGQDPSGPTSLAHLAGQDGGPLSLASSCQPRSRTALSCSSRWSRHDRVKLINRLTVRAP